MTFLDLFHPVSEWSADQLRSYLAAHHPDEIQLIDVRQLGEYGERHLPGARWIPPEELPERIAELDPQRTTIVYCSAGIRSRSAAAVLVRAGFRAVHSLQGGLRAWDGHLASGLPEARFRYFAAAVTAADYAALAWRLEENTRRFYAELADTLADPALAAVFAELAAAESHHKASLQSIWEALEGHPAAADFPAGLLPETESDRMEGGMRLGEALAWLEGRAPVEALELAMAIEINAYDHYLNLYDTLADENARRVFEILAVEERHHLRDLSRLWEERQLPV